MRISGNVCAKRIARESPGPDPAEDTAYPALLNSRQSPTDPVGRGQSPVQVPHVSVIATHSNRER